MLKTALVKTARTVVITGVAGFLGRYVARQFASSGWRIVGIDDSAAENVPLASGGAYHRMRLPSSALAEMLRREEPQALIHCAGRASVALSMEQPAADFRDNTALTFDMLDTLRQHAPECRFVLLSSAAVYGNPATLPVSEDHPVKPLSPYGYHKRQCELLCEEFARIYGMKTASVRIFSAYGPGLRRQVVWDICEKIIGKRELALHGTGLESRDFIHAADVARALETIVDKAACDGEIYNLASGREVTIAEVAALLVEQLGSAITPVFSGQVRAGDPCNWRADVSRIQALGFTTRIPFEQGTGTVATWASAELASL